MFNVASAGQQNLFSMQTDFTVNLFSMPTDFTVCTCRHRKPATQVFSVRGGPWVSLDTRWRWGTDPGVGVIAIFAALCSAAVSQNTSCRHWMEWRRINLGCLSPRRGERTAVEIDTARAGAGGMRHLELAPLAMEAWARRWFAFATPAALGQQLLGRRPVTCRPRLSVPLRETLS
jgi:hypothetical protein